MTDTQAYSFKVVIIGAASVGKSSLIRKYSDGIFQENTQSTIGVDLRLKTMQIQQQHVKLFFWDTAGQQRFKSIVQTYYKSSKGVLIVTDLTDENWKDGVNQWLSEVEQYGDPNAIKFLIGNKVDLVKQRKVSDSEIRKYAQENGLQYYESSAKVGTNLDKVFTNMGERLVSNYITKRKKERSTKLTFEPVSKPTRWWCW